MGEPVALTLTVTNTGSTPCRLASLSDGTIALTAVTRDGEVVTPTTTSTLR